MKAYNFAKRISVCTNNIQRKNFVLAKMVGLANYLGYELEVQKMDIDPRYGNENLILRSGHKNPLLITAHYDAFLINENSAFTTPGANDNGSGLGAVMQAALKLKGLPIDYVFFGAEEQDYFGSKYYVANLDEEPRGVVNLDTCGSGGDLGILIPDVVYVDDDELASTDKELNSVYLSAIQELGLQFCIDDPLASGDHCAFMKAGIPATTIQGEDHSFYGIVDGKYDLSKMIMHTGGDTINAVDKDFLENVVQVLIEGSKRLLND